MLDIARVAPDRLDISLSGTLDAAEMATGLDRLIAEAANITHGKMLYRIPEFHMPTPAAIGVEFSRLPSLIMLLGKFDKCAVLTDAGWLRTAAEIEGAVLPGLEIKAFGLQDDAAAEAWLDGVATDPETEPDEDDPFDDMPV